ncbi:hypothetical protein EVAR_95065_1 [Eumeta japonica]|uniref:F-box domain-containing protein n=1 Tax=Eumeta variegata TaxID=151549 RepID=A0A4C1W6G0_EUMVA|nr:hypothetical protein EVAR_95065_1 [Eumeta japonica]
MEADWTGASNDILLEIFGWLGGPELRAVAAVCQRWRALTLRGALWRRLLIAEGHLDASFAETLQDHEWNWRNEYWRVHAQWRLLPDSPTSSVVSTSPLTHVAFSNRAAPLLVAAADQNGIIMMWSKQEHVDKVWSENGTADVKTHGWRYVNFLQFSDNDDLLLVSGPLINGGNGIRGEIAVYRIQGVGKADSGLHIQCRVWCGPVAAHGCWVDECRLLAPRRLLIGDGQAITELWLTAADQHVHSENAPVMARLMRIFTAASSTVRFIRLATVKKNVAVERVEINESLQKQSVTVDTDSTGTSSREHGYQRPHIDFRHEYYNECLMETEKVEVKYINIYVEGDCQVLVYICSIQHNAPHALALTHLPAQDIDWPSPASTPPSLAHRRAERRAAVAAGILEADEHLTRQRLRASCIPPNALIDMDGAIVGLTLGSDNRCAWLMVREWEGSFARLSVVSLPSLRVVGVARPLSLLAAPRPYYAFPSASAYFVAAPSGGGREDADEVWLWTRTGGVAATLEHPANVSAAALSRPHAVAACSSGPAHLRHLCATAADDGVLRFQDFGHLQSYRHSELALSLTVTPLVIDCIQHAFAFGVALANGLMTLGNLLSVILG